MFFYSGYMSLRPLHTPEFQGRVIQSSISESWANNSFWSTKEGRMPGVRRHYFEWEWAYDFIERINAPESELHAAVNYCDIGWFNAEATKFVGWDEPSMSLLAASEFV